jgi:hypothetical protein
MNPEHVEQVAVAVGATELNPEQVEQVAVHVLQGVETTSVVEVTGLIFSEKLVEVDDCRMEVGVMADPLVVVDGIITFVVRVGAIDKLDEKLLDALEGEIAEAVELDSEVEVFDEEVVLADEVGVGESELLDAVDEAVEIKLEVLDEVGIILEDANVLDTALAEDVEIPIEVLEEIVDEVAGLSMTTSTQLQNFSAFVSMVHWMKHSPSSQVPTSLGISTSCE